MAGIKLRSHRMRYHEALRDIAAQVGENDATDIQVKVI